LAVTCPAAAPQPAGLTLQSLHRLLFCCVQLW
jgi:hypothetical protein